MTQAAGMTAAELARYIDHSVLKPEFSEAEIRREIAAGIAYGCATVCVNPAALEVARELCHGTATGISVVCDFPFGLSTTESKALQAELICRPGGVEDLDVVANYGWIRSGLWDRVTADFSAVVEVAHRYGTLVKVILETDALTLDELRRATEAAVEAGADFVKTSTGFFTGARREGATPAVIAAMLEAAAGRCRVKASGGIRDRASFLALIDMGVHRLGIGYRSTPVVLGLEGGL